MAVQYMVKPKDGEVFKVMVYEDRLAPQVPEDRDMAIYNQMCHLDQGNTYVMRVQGRVQEFNIYRLPYHGGDVGKGHEVEPVMLDLETLNAVTECIDFDQKLPELENMRRLQSTLISNESYRSGKRWRR